MTMRGMQDPPILAVLGVLVFFVGMMTVPQWLPVVLAAIKRWAESRPTLTRFLLSFIIGFLDGLVSGKKQR